MKFEFTDYCIAFHEIDLVAFALKKHFTPIIPFMSIVTEDEQKPSVDMCVSQLNDIRNTYPEFI